MELLKNLGQTHSTTTFPNYQSEFHGRVENHY
jgi:hypothetical protein